MKKFLAAGVVVPAVFVVGCASYDTRLTSHAVHYLGVDDAGISRGKASTLADANSYWDGAGVAGAPSVVINLTEQTAYFYKGSKLVGVSAISSGREGFDTPTGKFKIMEKDEDHASNLYGDFVDAATGVVVMTNVDTSKDKAPPGAVFKGAPMPFFMRITGGVGMHVGFLPGVPDSHGCIRMPEKMAKAFYASLEKGTPVEIVR